MSITENHKPAVADLPPAVANAIRRLNRPPLGDPPVDIASSLAPATIEVATNLAEDTVIAGVMDIAEGDNKVAMFSNPFSGGSEEMLYIDEVDRLRWARHVNPVDGVDPGGLSGWSIDIVAEHAGEVVTVVTTDGTVWAISTSIGKGSQALAYRLVADPAEPGGQAWEWAETLNLPAFSSDTLHILPVYYCNDRPATPVVFIDFPDRNTMYWLMANHTLATGEPPQRTWRTDSFAYFTTFRDATKMAGVDSPDTEFSQGPLVETIRVWFLQGTTMTALAYDPRTKLSQYQHVYVPVKRLIAPWTYLNRAGVWFQNAGPSETITGLFHTELTSWKYMEAFTVLDCPLDDLAVWQDAEGLAHVYGRDAEGSIRVAHQTGWMNSRYHLPPDTMLTPRWDSHTRTRPDGVEIEVTTTRPLVGSVASFNLDAYPDDMPSQHVMHQGAVPGETCAIYTQDLRSTLWHQERMRLIPETLPKPYVVPRYEAKLTVKNAFGTPVANCEVSLTADAPVDLEVAGRFYRTGTITPVSLVTDANGQVTLRVVARSLTVPPIHVTAPGMPASVTVQVAADVHKFLAGNGTLPNHSEGFNAEVVKKATKPDGSLLFPGIRRDGDAGDWPPSAQDVVTWCQGVFALDSGGPLPARMREGLADDEEVVAFAFQTRDPSRPGLEVFTSREQLDVRRESLRKEGIIDDLIGWVGDVWQGIQDGVVDLSSAFVNFVDQTIELVVSFVDEVEALVICAWDDIVSAVHAVEAVFVAVEAKIEDVVNWLKWAFSFDDALRTAKALRDVMHQAPRLAHSVLTEIGTVADDFFVEKEAEVRTYFDAMKNALGGQSLSSLQGPTATVPSASQPSPQVASVGDQAQSPHAQWFIQQLTNPGSSPTSESMKKASHAPVDPVRALIEEVFAVVSDAPAFETLSTAFKDLADVFAEFFSGKDPGSVVASQLVDILDFAENLVIGILELLDQLANDVLGWSNDVVTFLGALLDQPLEDAPFLKLIWDFVVEESGLAPADYPLTVGMLGAFLAGYPFTVLVKALTGKAPFASGGIPVPPTLGEPWHLDNDPSDEMLLFQAFQGLTQTVDLVLDGYINLNALSSGANPLPVNVTRAFAAAHLVAYVVGDYPWFWGYPPFKENKLPYFRWILTFFFNSYDLALAVDNGTLAEMFEGDGENVTPEQREVRETVLMLVTAAFGWTRIGINLAEYVRIPNRNDGNPPNWVDTWNLWINLTAYIQTATGFVRFMFKRVEPDTPAFYPVMVALVVKTAIDVAGDIYSGVCTVVQPMQEMFDRPTIDLGGSDHIRFDDAYLWQPYVSAGVSASGGWPPYDWSSVDDQNGPVSLAPGLSFETPYYDSDLGRIGRVTGTPTGFSPDAGSFFLRVEDGWGPTSHDRKFASLNVKPAPAGIPTADFTTSPESAQAPAQIQFTDTSTGAPSQWQWSLDNGQPVVEEANPLVEYAIADTYTVTLLSINDKGYSAPVTKQLVITAPPGTPVADFSYTDNPRSGAAVQFTDRSTGAPTSYLWDFGDGRLSSERNPLITYDNGGDYVVSLLCANASGWGVRRRQLVTVHWS